MLISISGNLTKLILICPLESCAGRWRRLWRPACSAAAAAAAAAGAQISQCGGCDACRGCSSSRQVNCAGSQVNARAGGGDEHAQRRTAKVSERAGE